MNTPFDPDPEDDDGRSISWPGFVITSEEGHMEGRYTVHIVTEYEGPEAAPTPDEIMTAIEEAVNEQNLGQVTMTVTGYEEEA